MRALTTGARLQLGIITHDANYWMVWITTPFIALALIAIMDNAGRADLVANAVMGAALVGMWGLSLFVAGDIVAADRELGLLESSLASPASFNLVTLGRVGMVSALSLISFVESWLVAALLVGEPVRIYHHWELVAGIVASVFAMSGTAVIMAGLFVVTRNAGAFQNSVSYPFYILGGVVVPVEFLPGVLQPLSRLVFLSWSSELLRATAEPGPIDGTWLKLGAIVGLGVAGFLAGSLLLGAITRQVRQTGSTALA